MSIIFYSSSINYEIEDKLILRLNLGSDFMGTTTSLAASYWFLGVTFLNIIFAVYFKALVIKTSPGSKSREKILGNMKDPLTWRQKNNTLSYIFTFWVVVSFILFIYFKFLSGSILVSTYYILGYAILIVISLSIIKIISKSIE